MIEIHLHEVDLNLRIGPDGIRHVALIDPASGIAVRVALPEEAAKQLAEALMPSGLVLAPASALKEIQH